MASHVAGRKLDPRLIDYLHAADEAAADRQLGRLIQDAQRIIQGILRRKWCVSLDGNHGYQSVNEQDAEDIQGEVIAQLVTRLRDLRSNSASEPIADFAAFVAASTNNAIAGRIRDKNPQRHCLKNRLHYLLTHRNDLCLWAGEGGTTLVGFAAWQVQTRPAPVDHRLHQMVHRPQRFGLDDFLGQDLGQLDPARLVAHLFNSIGGPIELDALVRLISELWALKEPAEPGEHREESSHDPHAGIADPDVNIAVQVEQRADLVRLWSEIRQLPLRQRAALLLNLRDARGRGVIAFLPMLGIASAPEIAETLGMSDAQFAALWNDLPLDDATIARHLDLTRPQVIDLRRRARERLARKVKLFDSES